MDDVLLDAPLAPSHDFLSALGAAGVLEVPGATPRQEGSDDPYQAARDRGLHRWLDLRPTSPEATGGAEPAPEPAAAGMGVEVGGLGVGVSAMVHRVHAQQAALAAKIARKRVAEEDYYANRYRHTTQQQAPQPPPGPGPPHPTS